jgi:hypothetical protein
VTRDIAAHVRLRHRFDYTYFADLAADEDEVLRAGRGVSLAYNPRPLVYAPT